MIGFIIIIFIQYYARKIFDSMHEMNGNNFVEQVQLRIFKILIEKGYN